jgi:hypothetical protein
MSAAGGYKALALPTVAGVTLRAVLKNAGPVADNPHATVMATRLNITYSAYRELETIPQTPLRDIGEAIIALADDPHPPGSSLLKGIGGCYYIAIDDYYILYHMDEEDGLTVLGVLHGPYHPLH